MSEQQPTEQRRSAVALSYRDSSTPHVVARGYGEAAQRILELAAENGIFVHDSPELVELLMQVDLDEQIPPMLYDVISQLLLWVEEMRAADEA